MSKEIAEYFDTCIEGIIKVIFLPIAIIAIILKHLVKGEIQMSEADKMFEKLKYRKEEGDDCWLYFIKKYYNSTTKIISFELNEEYIFVSDNNDECMPISIQELQAINKKCEELGWI